MSKNEIDDSGMKEKVVEFKTINSSQEQKAKKKFYAKQYRLHMRKLKNVKQVDPTDDSPEGVAKIKRLNKFVRSHIGHSMILKDYIKSFLPNGWKEELLEFTDKTVFYNGKEL